MKDSRAPLEDALTAFRKFAANNERPTDFVWISQDRVWIYQPDEMKGDEGAKKFYESAREHDSSIRLLGIYPLGKRYLTCVEKMPSPPHDPNQLYMSLHENPRYQIIVVTNWLLWLTINLIPSYSRRNRHLREGLSLHRTMRTA